MSSKPILSIVCQFPGQGSQEVGMLKAPIEQYGESSCRDRVQALNQLVPQLPLWSLMTQGPISDLTLTHCAQPAILLTSSLYWGWWNQLALPLMNELLGEWFEINVNAVLGHSLGEYSALCAASAMSWEEAIVLTHQRGLAMQQASPVGEGSMWAILKLPLEVIEQGLAALNRLGHELTIANYNTDQQHVLAGKKSAIAPFQAWVKEHFSGPWRCLELPVSAPFHSPLMTPAKKLLAPTLESTTFHQPLLGYVANVDGQYYPPEQCTVQHLKCKLTDQLAGPVKWYQGLQHLYRQRPFHLLVEMGHGQILTGLAQKILPPSVLKIPLQEWMGTDLTALKTKISGLRERLLAHGNSSSL